MKNQEMQNVVFTAIDIDSLIEKIAKKVLLIIESNIEKQNHYTQYEDLLNKAISDCDLSIRAYRVCWNAEIKTLGELASVKRDDLIKLRNCGRKSQLEFETLLNKHNLTFGMNLSKYGIK
jgi:DNA-directed RNA polymerase subunit alpha